MSQGKTLEFVWPGSHSLYQAIQQDWYKLNMTEEPV